MDSHGKRETKAKSVRDGGAKENYRGGNEKHEEKLLHHYLTYPNDGHHR